MNNSQGKKPQGKAQTETWPEKMKLSLARKFLGISPSKMTHLIHNGMIKYEEDPFDHRVKLVRREDLEALLRTRTGA
jgi:hypothetical protein